MTVKFISQPFISIQETIEVTGCAFQFEKFALIEIGEHVYYEKVWVVINYYEYKYHYYGFKNWLTSLKESGPFYLKPF